MYIQPGSLNELGVEPEGWLKNFEEFCNQFYTVLGPNQQHLLFSLILGPKHVIWEPIIKEDAVSEVEKVIFLEAPVELYWASPHNEACQFHGYHGIHRLSCRHRFQVCTNEKDDCEAMQYSQDHSSSRG